MVKISYVVTACNEIQELKILLPKLIKFYKPSEGDEIVVQLDTSRTDEVFEYVQQLKTTSVNFKLIEFPLNKDFASFKNNYIKECSGQYIINFDADEVPHDNLLNTLKEVIFNNPEVDLFYIPRINIVPGIEYRSDLIEKWRWNLNDKKWINSPDYQGRIWRNTSSITWENKVHEKLTGFKTHAMLPVVEDYSIIHIKSLERQIKQNELYDTITI